MLNGLILILGSTNDIHGKISTIGKQRLDKGIEVYRSHPDYKFLITGGFGKHFNQTNIPYAQYAKEYLKKHSVPESAFFELVLSEDTVDEIKKITPIINREKPLTFVVITSDFHMQRVKFIFSKMHLIVSPEFIAVPYNAPLDELRNLIDVESREMKLLVDAGISSLGNSLN